MWRPAVLALLLIASATAAGAKTLHAEPYSSAWNASVTVDLSQRQQISSVLFGIFFEEIGHAGDGGLYAELVQDRSFDALAAATGFLAAPPDAPPLRLYLPALARRFRHPMEPLHSEAAHRSKADFLAARRQQMRNGSADPLNDIIVAWQPLPGTAAELTKDRPLNEGNPVSMLLTALGPKGSQGGLLNFGYWGVALEGGSSYTASIYLRSPKAGGPRNVSVALVSEDGSKRYASVEFLGVTDSWQRFTGELTSSDTDSNARVAVLFDGPGTLQLDYVSVFPTENVEAGRKGGYINPWPFRADLLGALKDLKPAFLRFPGGCFVEGDWMRNAVRWKEGIGANEERPGHMNGVWGYWSTDGLGLFEYMLLSDELKTEPIWVINSGVAHGDSIRGADIWPWVEEALDSLEFISGSPNSTWGARRAEMGHPEPWAINYMAIGNEDCGKPYYLQNYLAFFGALRARYPHLRLIANCDMGSDAPTDLWDWHIYTSPTDMFNKRREFDGRTPANSNYIFASEYAVTDGGGWGNVAAAVSEAAFMTGLERNGGIVTLAAYAPLFVHWNNRPWPTNMIVIDNHRWFGIPSYYVQQMFAQTAGTHYLSTAVVHSPSSEVHEDKVAASATCGTPACDRLHAKIVNFSSYRQRVAVVLDGAGDASVGGQGHMTFLHSDHPEDENSFEQPTKVASKSAGVDGLGSKFVLTLEPWSVNILEMSLKGSKPHDAASGALRGGSSGAGAGVASS